MENTSIPQSISSIPSKEESLTLLYEYVQSQSLRTHCENVAKCMMWHANKFGIAENEKTTWFATGILHDFDYEKFPDWENGGHPFKGCEILKEMGVSEIITRAILSHANYSGVSRDSLMEKTLFAVDELSGFVTAASLVRPDKDIRNVEVKSILKRMKDKAFARAVSREDITEGAKLLEITLEEHIQNVITALSN